MLGGVVRSNNGENDILTISDEEGLCALTLLNLLEELRASVGLEGLRCMPVALCLPGVESSITRIVQANNEGDNSHLWLKVSEEIEQDLCDGLGCGYIQE